MMASSVLGSPSPCLLFHPNSSSNVNGASLTLSKRSPPRAPHSSGTQQNASSLCAMISDATDSQLPIEDAKEEISIGGCRACGKAEIEKGCNGEGRIQGGIATVPGFGWWPIKAFRPCPGLVAAGGRYRRQGQSMDEVAFGKADGDGRMASDEVERSKKRNPRRFRG